MKQYFYLSRGQDGEAEGVCRLEQRRAKRLNLERLSDADALKAYFENQMRFTPRALAAIRDLQANAGV